MVSYEERYQPGAGRYNMGEVSNFVYTPMLTTAIRQILEWQPQNIQDYCQQISSEAIEELRKLGCFIEEEDYRAKHLFGIYLPNSINIEELKIRFNQQKVFVSFRGKAIRVSPNIYNTKTDFDKLVGCFK